MAFCRAKKEKLLTNKNQALARWKEHFEEHLNEGSETEGHSSNATLVAGASTIPHTKCQNKGLFG
jgi:hypothetical protein